MEMKTEETTAAPKASNENANPPSINSNSSDKQATKAPIISSPSFEDYRKKYDKIISQRQDLYHNQLETLQRQRFLTWMKQQYQQILLSPATFTPEAAFNFTGQRISSFEEAKEKCDGIERELQKLYEDYDSQQSQLSEFDQQLMQNFDSQFKKKISTKGKLGANGTQKVVSSRAFPATPNDPNLPSKPKPKSANTSSVHAGSSSNAAHAPQSVSNTVQKAIQVLQSTTKASQVPANLKKGYTPSSVAGGSFPFENLNKKLKTPIKKDKKFKLDLRRLPTFFGHANEEESLIALGRETIKDVLAKYDNIQNPFVASVSTSTNVNTAPTSSSEVDSTSSKMDEVKDEKPANEEKEKSEEKSETKESSDTSTKMESTSSIPSSDPDPTVTLASADVNDKSGETETKNDQTETKSDKMDIDQENTPQNV